MAYPGGKAGSGVYQKLINLMPPHTVYIEPFLGGAAVMRLKRPAQLNIGVDLVPSSKLPILPATSPKTARSAATVFPDDACRRISPDLARNGHSRSHNTESGDGGRRFEFRHEDGIAFLRAYPFTGSELVYCDPPYLRSTRSGRRLYEFEMTDRQHRELLATIRRLPCFVLISGYWSDLYASALKSWHHLSFDAMTRGGLATEHLWFNFAPPLQLHDYRYLGDTFRERERIKRKKQRWTDRLRRMPDLERQALLAAIAETAVSGDAGSNRQK